MSGHYTTKRVDRVDTAIRMFLNLRDRGFWSFRGQRKERWELGLHHPPHDERFDVCLKQFEKRCMEFPRPDYVDDADPWRWLFYAQHHRLRTRLLDWTTNPLVALYFAVENIISGGDDKRDFGAVWALKVRDIDFQGPEEAGNPGNVHRWFMINPPPLTVRIVRQSGKFSYHPPEDDAPLCSGPRRYPEEELVKVVLKGRDGSNPSRTIRKQLGIMNVHHASLFPDADGVASFVNHEWPDIAIAYRP